ncbi:DUF2029 domain-containing protein [bacterium]|nr:DUF2029 domain-containing protein [bacterium]
MPTTGRWLISAYLLLMIAYCLPYPAGPKFWRRWIHPLERYVWFGHGCDLERLYKYSELMRGARVDLAHLKEWSGDLGAVGEFLPTSRPNQPLLPYRDFALEYPPVCVPLFWLPRLATSSLTGYRSAFALEMALWMGGALTLALSWVGWPPQAQGRRQRLWLLTALATAALGPLVVSRLDAAVAFFLMGAMVSVRHHRAALCGLFLGLATGAKLLPALLLPAFLLHWGSQHKWVRAGRCLGAFCWTVLLVFGPAAWVGGSNLRLLFAYHSQRPVEIESSYASLMLLHKFLGGPEMVAQAFGSRCLRAPYESFVVGLATLAPLVLCGTVLGLYGRFLKKHPEADEAARCAALLRCVVALLTAMLISMKVLSPQFLTPLIPLIFLLDDRPAGVRATDVLMLTACLLTQIIFPGCWDFLEEPPRLLPALILGLRNALLVLLWYRIVQPWLRP